MKLVYIAGPYSHPDPVANTHNAVAFADDLYVECKPLLVPVVPHLSMLWHAIRPHDIDFWYEYDHHLLARCDALFRLPGPSTGADAEREVAFSLGLPVFYDREELVRWAMR